MSIFPIIFTAPMIRALLREIEQPGAGKTQTRRILKPQPPADATASAANDGVAIFGALGHAAIGDKWRCPYGKPGDLLIPAVEIAGYDGKYAAGVDGRIYSRARGPWRALKVWRNTKSYPSVTVMSPGGRKQSKAVHRLVCEAFYGRPPTPAHQVRHLDGDPENGKPDNLAWGTQEENWQDRKAHGNGCEGEKHHAAKLSDEEREHIRWAVANGLCSQRHAARAMDMSLCAIQGVCSQVPETPEQETPGDRTPDITLHLADVRVERIQDISEADARSEGMETEEFLDYDDWQNSVAPPDIPCTFRTLRSDFQHLWDSINAKRGYAWSDNPWVWALTFRPILANVDDVLSDPGRYGVPA